MKTLVIAAHPDDEVLGCGGTIARMSAEGHEVHIAILGEGITSRCESRSHADPKEIETLHAHAKLAGDILGAASVEVFDLPDNRFDTVALLEVIKLVEQLIDRYSPQTVFTHHSGDLNIDHVITHRAVLTTTRPVAGSPVKDVYAFEVASSTEWAFSAGEHAFKPNTFLHIEGFIDAKCKAMAAYGSEARGFPHPRSDEALRAQAAHWGATSGRKAAEAFQLVRSIR